MPEQHCSKKRLMYKENYLQLTAAEKRFCTVFPTPGKAAQGIRKEYTEDKRSVRIVCSFIHLW